MLFAQCQWLLRGKSIHNIARLFLASRISSHKGTQVQVHSSDLITMASPKLIVFDLDYTLWPFWVDTHVDPPFRQASNGKVYDSHGEHVKFYNDVPMILRNLHTKGHQLGIASRTGCIDGANDLTRLFNWDQFFHFRQIFPGCKITHFKNLHKQSGIPFEDMLFFDDEHRNIVDVSSLGVTCKIVESGVDERCLAEGLELFQQNRAKTQGGRS